MSGDNIFCVTPEEFKAIKSFSGKSDKEISEGVAKLKSWVTLQPHLPQNEDEMFFEMIFRLNKFNIEKSQKKIDMFYSIRNIVPEFYEDRNPNNTEMKNFNECFALVPLPKLDSAQRRVYLVQFLEADPSKFDSVTLAKTAFNMFDLRLHNDPAVGDVFIIDVKHLTLGHIWKLNLLVIKKIYNVLEKGYSDRINAVHFINLSAVGNILVTIIKYVLSAKLNNRVYSHKDLDSLHKHVPKNILPLDLNGYQKSFKDLQNDWQLYIENRASWLVELGNKRTNEELRPEKKPETSSMFGYFRNQRINNL